MDDHVLFEWVFIVAGAGADVADEGFVFTVCALHVALHVDLLHKPKFSKIAIEIFSKQIAYTILCVMF